jgi:hypothetical protein
MDFWDLASTRSPRYLSDHHQQQRPIQHAIRTNPRALTVSVAVGRLRTFALDRPALSAAIVGAALGVVGLFNDFVYDDGALIRDDARIHSLANLRAIVLTPYWPAPYVRQLYRPLSTLGYALQYVAGNGSPILFRIVTLCLYAAICYQVVRIASFWLSNDTALGIGVLFALHPVHVEALAQAVNQSELAVCLLALLIVNRYVRCRQAAAMTTRDWIFIGASYAAACLIKESGFILPALLVLADLTVRRKSAAPWVGLVMLASFGALIYGLRLPIVGGESMRVIARPLENLGLLDRMHVMLQIVPDWIRLLLWPQRLSVDYVPRGVVFHAGVNGADILSLLLITVWIVLVGVAWRRNRVAAFGLLWCAIALFPVSNVIPTGVLLAERTLLLPSVGLLLALGAASEALRHRYRTAFVGEMLLTLALCLCALGAIKSANRLSLWNSRHFVVSPGVPGAS